MLLQWLRKQCCLLTRGPSRHALSQRDNKGFTVLSKAKKYVSTKRVPLHITGLDLKMHFQKVLVMYASYIL